MGVTFLLLRALHGLLFNVPLLVAWILIGLLCIGAGKARLHYHAYLNAAARDDAHAREAMASELTLIHGVPPDCDESVSSCVNCRTRCYGTTFAFTGAVILADCRWPVGTCDGGWLCLLRARQSGWRAIRHRTSVCNRVLMRSLHVLDWILVRLAGVVYALLGTRARRRCQPGLRRLLICILRNIRCLRVWRSSRWRANLIPIKSETPKACCFDGEEDLVCGGGDYCDC